MDNLNQKEFLSFIQDEAFIRLVKESTNIDSLLEEIIKKYPENKSDITYAVEFIRMYAEDQKNMDNTTYNLLLENILEHARVTKTTNVRKLFISRIWKVATILIIFSLGALFTYYQFGDDQMKELAQNDKLNSNQAVIILSDGSKKFINGNNSCIDYGVAQGEIIIMHKNKMEERVSSNLGSNPPGLNQVFVPYGQRHKIRLSDGTLVQLNAGSKLVFPASFSGKKRQVYLKGQGYFEVHHDDNIPFIVRTDYLDIEDIGTAFDVSAYDDEKFATTILIEGEVEVSQKNNLLKNEVFTLNPGEGCFYSIKNQESKILTVDTNDYVSWKDGLFQFKNMTLQDVVKRVQKYYNKSIQIEGNDLAMTIVSGKLILSENFEHALQYLSKIIEGHYQMQENDISILKH